MKEKEQYRKIDEPVYLSCISPYLPKKVLDFHTHIWKKDHWKVLPWKTDVAGGRYMVIQEEYTAEQFLSDMRHLFPDRRFSNVCFGLPNPSFDVVKSNTYLIESAKKHNEILPLLLVGKGLASKKEIEDAICEKGFFGYKVITPWQGDNYGDFTVKDMIGHNEMEIADKYGLIVLLHLPRPGRLTDPVVQKEVREYARNYPDANIVLAHCGRCYHPDDMFKAVHSIKNLKNVYLDTAMVMEPMVLQILFSEIDSSRIVFATDIPISMMRGRRVYVKDHWVDVVLKGYPPSTYRVEGDNFGATFMVYEIILTIIRAAKISGLSKKEISGIFYNNGLALLRHKRR